MSDKLDFVASVTRFDAVGTDGIAISCVARLTPEQQKLHVITINHSAISPEHY
jgi:hypothetical protein